MKTLTVLLRRAPLPLIALLVIVTLIALPVLTYPLGRDQGEFATIGRGLLQGRIPYQELWNPKPPAVFYVYALAMAVFGQTSEALRALDLLIFPVIGTGLWWLGRRLASSRVGLWAALLFGVFYFTETFWTLTQNDGIALLPMVLAAVCVVKTLDGRGGERPFAPAGRFAFLWPFLAGALCAWAVWFKYPFALFGAALVAAYVSLGTEFQRKRFVFHLATVHEGFVIAALLLGVIFVGVGGLVYLAAIGALDDLIESARLTSQYTALTFNPDEFGPLMQTALGFRWQHWGLLWVLAALWFVIGLVVEPRSRLWRLVWLWLLAGTAIMLVQAKGYDYHWLPMLPPLALLAADTLDQILQTLMPLLARIRVLSLTIGRVASFTVTMFALLALLAGGIWPKAWAYLTGQEDQTAYFSRFQAGEFVADESLRVANLLRERVVPGDSLFIWGFRPEVYYLSRLNPATRFIFQFPLAADWYPTAWRQETVDTLWAAMPPYALVLQVDYMPWVTGRHEDSNTLLQEYTELNNWLVYNYERDTQIGNFFIWRRKR